MSRYDCVLGGLVTLRVGVGLGKSGSAFRPKEAQGFDGDHGLGPKGRGGGRFGVFCALGADFDPPPASVCRDGGGSVGSAQRDVYATWLARRDLGQSDAHALRGFRRPGRARASVSYSRGRASVKFTQSDVYLT